MRLALIAALVCLASAAMAQTYPTSGPVSATAPTSVQGPFDIHEGESVLRRDSTVKFVTDTASASEPATGEAPALAPTTTSAPSTTSAPTSTSAAIDPEAYKLLVQLQKAGEKYETLQAGIEYKVENPVLATEEIRSGAVAYQRETDKMPPKFRIQFDTVKYGTSAVAKEQLEYAFDGQWLTISKGKIKNMTRKQIAAPGEKVEPLKLGKGPFPLPFGQKADEVADMFDVKTRQSRPSDPRNTAFLELTPKAGKEKDYDFTRLQMWVDQENFLPVKIVSVGRNRDITTVLFKDVKPGVQFDQKTFKPDKPAGWEMVIEPLEKK